MSDLRKIRVLKGLTLKDTAEAVGITKQRYAQIEKLGLSSTKEETARKIADYLGVDIFAILGSEVLKVTPKTPAEWRSLTSALNKAKAGKTNDF